MMRVLVKLVIWRDNDEKNEKQNDGDDGAGGAAEYFRIDGEYEVNRFLKNARFNDGVKANFGTVDDLQIYHDGRDSYIKDAGTGTLKILTNGLEIKNAADTGYMAFFGSTGASQLYFNTALKFETTSTGIEVSGTSSTFAGNAHFTGNVEVGDGTDTSMSASSDGQLRIDGSGS